MIKISPQFLNIALGAFAFGMWQNSVFAALAFGALLSMLARRF